MSPEIPSTSGGAEHPAISVASVSGSPTARFAGVPYEVPRKDSVIESPMKSSLGGLAVALPGERLHADFTFWRWTCEATSAMDESDLILAFDFDFDFDFDFFGSATDPPAAGAGEPRLARHRSAVLINCVF